MTKTTIYLAKIIKPNDYATDIAVALEAFDSMDKAKGFMEANGMVEMSWGWVMTDSNLEGSIETLKVK
jgi:hypothetical protein